MVFIKRHRNKLLTYIVILTYFNVLCHNFSSVEGTTSSSPVSTSQDKDQLSNLFPEDASLSPQFRSLIDSDAGYYYDGDDDPYGIANKDGEDLDYEYDDYENYDGSGEENFSTKVGKWIFNSNFPNTYVILRLVVMKLFEIFKYGYNDSFIWAKNDSRLNDVHNR